MLALAPINETPTKTDSPLSQRQLSQRVASLLAALLLLLLAAGSMSLFMLHDAGLSRDARSEGMSWVAGLLAVALLFGAVLAASWLRQQGRVCRATEARVRQHVLELALLKRSAEAANAAKRRLLAELDHEMRTPLQAIAGFAQLLQLQARQPAAEAQRHGIEGMAQAAWHLQALLEDLQQAAQVEPGPPRLHICDLEIEPVIDEALRMMQLQADKAGVRLAPFVRNGEHRCVRADPLRLRQILLNLLANAIKYGRRGGHVRVDVNAGSNDTLHLQVIDNGIGMQRQQLAHLFEPLKRPVREEGTSSGAHAGSGIGLTLVRHWMQLMRGEIRVESQPGTGTTVHLQLPAAAAPQEEPDGDMR